MSEQVGSLTHKKASGFHGGIRFQSSFTIRWELEDKNFVKIDIICLDDSLKYRIMAIKTNENFIPFSNNVTFRTEASSGDGLGNCFWIDTRLLSVKVKCPDPGVASHDQKPDSGDSPRHQIPSPCPHSPPPPPPTGFTLIGALYNDLVELQYDELVCRRNLWLPLHCLGLDYSDSLFYGC